MHCSVPAPKGTGANARDFFTVVCLSVHWQSADRGRSLVRSSRTFHPSIPFLSSSPSLFHPPPSPSPPWPPLSLTKSPPRPTPSRRKPMFSLPVMIRLICSPFSCPPSTPLPQHMLSLAWSHMSCATRIGLVPDSNYAISMRLSRQEVRGGCRKIHRGH